MSINFSFMKVTTERLEQVLQELKVEKSVFISDFNLSKQNYQHWKERGIPGNRLISICGYLGITLDELTGKKIKKAESKTFTSSKADRFDIFNEIETMSPGRLDEFRLAIELIKSRKQKKSAEIIHVDLARKEKPKK